LHDSGDYAAFLALMRQSQNRCGLSFERIWQGRFKVCLSVSVKPKETIKVSF